MTNNNYLFQKFLNESTSVLIETETIMGKKNRHSLSSLQSISNQSIQSSPLPSPSISNHSPLQSPSPSNSNLNQIVKCNKCQIHIIRNNLIKHEKDEKLCGCINYIEYYYQLINYKLLDDVFIKNNINLFNISFIINDNLLYTSSVEKIKTNDDNDDGDDENILFISNELMNYLNLNQNQIVNVVHFNLMTTGNSTNNFEKTQFYRIKSYNLFKNLLSIGFSNNNNNLNKQSTTTTTKLFSHHHHQSLLYCINFKINAIPLKYLFIEICREFYDPYIYLQICYNIKKFLLKKILNKNEKFIKLLLNNMEYTLKIISINLENVLDNLDNDLENEMKNLSINNNNNNDAMSAFIITNETKIIFQPLKYNNDNNNNKKDEIKFIGYEKQIELLKNLLSSTTSNKLSKNILLTGISGCGKTLLIKNLLKNFYGKKNILELLNISLMSKQFEYEKILQFIKFLINLSPIILLIDNLEDLFTGNNSNNRIISWFKILFDQLKQQQKQQNDIIIIGITNRPELIDNQLRQCNRFDIEINFPIPTPVERKLIFNELLNKLFNDIELNDEQIEQLILNAHGFTGGDLYLILKNYLINNQNLNDKTISTIFNDLYSKILKTKPNQLRDITLQQQTADIKWTDIGGMNNIKQLLEECIVLPIKYPELFKKFNIDSPKGILMYGPPGCCKTMIGKALANESGLNFFSIKGPELFNKWVGESERAIREIFQKARLSSPSIIFFDEIDAIACERRQQSQSVVGDRVLAQLLTEMDGIENLGQVIIIAATNRPDIIDKALLRPGRLDSIVYVPLPDYETRKEIFKIRLSKMPIEFIDDESNNNIEKFLEILAEKSNGYSGAEINAICQRAALLSIATDKQQDKILTKFFLQSFELIHPQTSNETIKFYENFASKYNVM